ncbi:hypothetical protein, partial [Staphylococcus ureilyticus]|uniref:hypothetical protein n=1 Tax=Staphylococcus ureilyticus TaxID=94138 RepID=UPI001C4A50C2
GIESIHMMIHYVVFLVMSLHTNFVKNQDIIQEPFGGKTHSYKSNRNTHLNSTSRFSDIRTLILSNILMWCEHHVTLCSCNIS